MPIYEYECEACGHRFEAIQKFSDAPLADCPECGKSALKKLLSASAFHLKGGGWYQTDFKDKNKKSEKKSESESKPAGCAGGACGCH
jgi:putative FmdB family regulatory protein